MTHHGQKSKGRQTVSFHESRGQKALLEVPCALQ